MMSLATDLARNAERIAAAGTTQTSLFEERNRLWAAAVKAGMTHAEVGTIYGLQAQTIKWNLSRRDVSTAPNPAKARHRGKQKTAR